MYTALLFRSVRNRLAQMVHNKQVGGDSWNTRRRKDLKIFPKINRITSEILSLEKTSWEIKYFSVRFTFFEIYFKLGKIIKTRTFLNVVC